MGFWHYAVVISLLLLSACDSGTEIGGLPVPEAPVREMDVEQIALGGRVFQAHCATCHGAQAEGDAGWHQRDADGFYPAPPLNGSGHAWHHSREALMASIANGSPKGKGKMPAWKDKLSNQEIEAIVVWMQSKWPQPVYDTWYEMQQRGK